MLCPADTPEGESCGLVKNLALMTHITTGRMPAGMAASPEILCACPDYLLTFSTLRSVPSPLFRPGGGPHRADLLHSGHRAHHVPVWQRAAQPGVGPGVPQRHPAGGPPQAPRPGQGNQVGRAGGVGRTDRRAVLGGRTGGVGRTDGRAGAISSPGSGPLFGWALHPPHSSDRAIGPLWRP